MKTYQDMIPSIFNAKDALSGKEINVNGTLEVAPKLALILEIK